MAGIGLLILMFLYVFFGLKVFNVSRNKTSPTTSFFIALTFIGLPFADAYVGRVALKRACSAESRVSILKKIANVNGIGIDYGVSNESPNYYGYSYVEGGFAYKSWWMIERAELLKDTGEVTVEKRAYPKSIYRIKEISLKESFYFRRTRISVIDWTDESEIAGFTEVSFKGGWAERVLMAFSDAGPSSVARCGNSESKKLAMLHAALQPSLLTHHSSGTGLQPAP